MAEVPKITLPSSLNKPYNIKSLNDNHTFLLDTGENTEFTLEDAITLWDKYFTQNSSIDNLKDEYGLLKSTVSRIIARFDEEDFDVEDFDEEDWDGWKKMTEKIGHKVQLVGDDLFVTNTERLSKGIKNGCGNSILIKLNQIGSVSETLEAIKMAHKAGYTAISSHRSGETADTKAALKLAQTNLRNVIGDMELDSTLTSREKINNQLKINIERAED